MRNLSFLKLDKLLHHKHNLTGTNTSWARPKTYLLSITKQIDIYGASWFHMTQDIWPACPNKSC